MNFPTRIKPVAIFYILYHTIKTENGFMLLAFDFGSCKYSSYKWLKPYEPLKEWVE